MFYRVLFHVSLQQWLWDEATIIADEILNCELGAVLERAPDLALASSGEGEDLTEDDLDNFLDYCRRVVAIKNFRIDFDRPSGPIPELRPNKIGVRSAGTCETFWFLVFLYTKIDNGEVFVDL